jgi:transcriptional regulator with XRE-family HTH domain
MIQKKRVPLGPTGETVRRNVARLRDEQNLTYAELARRTEDVGRPIPMLGARRIEAAERRVDVDDLMALAAALGVSPTTLLMPDTAEGDMPVSATGITDEISARELLEWLCVRAALPGDTRPSFGFLAVALPRWKAHEEFEEGKRRKGEHIRRRRAEIAAQEKATDGDD